jgi:hypothetical protein
MQIEYLEVHKPGTQKCTCSLSNCMFERKKAQKTAGYEK